MNTFRTHILSLTFRQPAHTVADLDGTVSPIAAADLRPETWSRLPLDIMNVLSDCVEQETSTKAAWSQLSLVCHGWARFCRPALFRSLHLDTDGDTTFLSSVLRSSTSGWLAEHVEYITFAGTLCTLRSHAAEQIIRRLRRLKTLHLAPAEDPEPSCTRPSVFASAISLRGPLSHIRDLSVISLASLHFPSFCILLRLLASCPTLVDITLVAVTWSGALDPAELPARLPLLPHVRSVRASQVSQVWPLSWVATMAAVEYRSPLRFDMADVVPTEITAIARTTELMFDTDIKHAPRHWALPHLKEYVVCVVNRTPVHPLVTIEAGTPAHGLSFSVCPATQRVDSSYAPFTAHRMTINTLRLQVSMYWKCWTVSKLPWSMLGAQWAQLPALKSVVVSYKRELFQREAHVFAGHADRAAAGAGKPRHPTRPIAASVGTLTR
ncbi:hypothetical protein PsYK624_116060 [Phanerochaete sordida]|uniref:Uncharacterized protein n=1 Tax=Phanerochaete sordida TaxID=48140 RepID=A0A9P3GGY5_9APHY|nr:hypothetical protein PsYK624_116060 [Phanerochaete sordida]